MVEAAQPDEESGKGGRMGSERRRDEQGRRGGERAEVELEVADAGNGSGGSGGGGGGGSCRGWQPSHLCRGGCRLHHAHVHRNLRDRPVCAGPLSGYCENTPSPLRAHTHTKNKMKQPHTRPCRMSCPKSPPAHISHAPCSISLCPVCSPAFCPLCASAIPIIPLPLRHVPRRLHHTSTLWSTLWSSNGFSH